MLPKTPSMVISKERLGEVAGLQEIIETQAVHLKPGNFFSDWKGVSPFPPKTKTKEQKSGKMFNIFPGEMDLWDPVKNSTGSTGVWYST